ncbi:hypothetical protein LR48_Vigan07g240000 [Vigna angularis]|uniref:HMA domain-containing protein n=1 Tax=Phaseolus angularis TaxID=3914 RepID=A0A0L9V169_PHAAN|nr:hypothetical protein LR48_Vigan07g240000 [Vigna angularis]
MAAKPPQLAAQPLNYQVEGRVSWRFTLFCVRGVVSVQFRLLLSCRMASSGDDCPMTKLSVRHSFSTKYICTLNERLTDEHRSLIVRTPFAWFLDVNVNVKVGVFTATIDPQLNKVTVTGSVAVETLLRKLVRAGKQAEIWPENDGKISGNGQQQQQKKKKNEVKELQSVENHKGTENASAKCNKVVFAAYNRLYPSYYVPSSPYTWAGLDQDCHHFQSAPLVSFEIFSDENVNGCSVM